MDPPRSPTTPSPSYGAAPARECNTASTSKGTGDHAASQSCRSRLHGPSASVRAQKDAECQDAPCNAERRSSHVFVTSVRMASTPHRTASIMHAGSLTVHTISFFPPALQSFLNLHRRQLQARAKHKKRRTSRHPQSSSCRTTSRTRRRGPKSTRAQCARRRRCTTAGSTAGASWRAG